MEKGTNNFLIGEAMRFLSSIALLLGAVPFPAESAPPPPKTSQIEPTTPWTMNYTKDECQLSRTFGTGNQSLTVQLSRGSGLGSFDLTLTGKALPKLESEISVTMRIKPKRLEQQFDAISGKLSGQGRYLRWNDADAATLESLANAQQVQFVATGKLDVSLVWQGARAALKAMQTCHDDLLKSWGADVAAIGSVAIQPSAMSPRESWISGMDYPSKSLREELAGVVIAQLTLTEKGVPSFCRVLVSSTSTDLDLQTCKVLIARAKYQPAKGAKGNPVASYSVERIRYILPESCKGRSTKGLGLAVEAIMVC